MKLRERTAPDAGEVLEEIQCQSWGEGAIDPEPEMLLIVRSEAAAEPKLVPPQPLAACDRRETRGRHITVSIRATRADSLPL